LHGGAGDEVYMRQLDAFAAKHLKPFGLNFIQIDDKWQKGRIRNGPAKDFSGHNPQGPYPSGMKAAADDIKASGFAPGIWFMPFSGDHEDPAFADHNEWFVRHKTGELYETQWGGTCLDMTYQGSARLPI
jgi:alpha-galactosidase